ncbi:uncharacterized protein LOC115967843 isoform X4 [Quercus lobata]|uniref:uncharacterized protein LOC115967843 isoform X4 n=1 Tax=Quercus lobata TaxID=97700 RepID=UPI0012447F30|nr:uncharacterized protein LOC115967843 isoform X4 [Quercus lobata]
MDNEVPRVEVKKMKTIRRDTAAVCAIALRITGSLINMVLLLWTIHSGIEIATETEAYMDYEYSQWAFHVGVVTMFFGFLILALGIPILADLFLKLTEQLQQQEEENGTHQEREMTIREVIVCLFVDVIILFMLLWIIFTALGLTLEPIGDGQYSIHHYLIKSVVGNVTALIGFCYFAFGVGIAVELSSMLQPKEKKGSSVHEEHNTNLECLV